MKVPKHILPVIVLSQFCCTSLWFAGNGVMSDLLQTFRLDISALGHLTSAVQFGFISGTLLLALLTIADRFSPSRVFLGSAIAGALCNAGILWDGNTLASLVSMRFLTGFFLAGIYPVGMKIAADYYEKGLGKSLGFLVGALVLGTALPHLLKEFTTSLPWEFVIIATSSLALLGGLLMMVLVPDGPHRRSSKQLDLSASFRVFRSEDFRKAAIGYFGHMWELYAFWAFVPLILSIYNATHPTAGINVPLWSFLVIGIGGPACVLGGYLSTTLGERRTATIALTLSGMCCLLSPIIFHSAGTTTLLGFLLFWGMVVVADSPLFSTLVARNAPSESRGTALTIVNCIGFAITILSIQLLNALYKVLDPAYIYLLLAAGPIFGLVTLYRKKIK